MRLNAGEWFAADGSKLSISSQSAKPANTPNATVGTITRTQ